MPQAMSWSRLQGCTLSRKKILITNDDGIDGEGLRALAARMSECCDVYILAPDSNRSAVSSMITMGRHIELKKHSRNAFSCSGSPADCVIAALRSELFGVQFDAVFSGINSGPNMGTDVVYSGTCAAARQAVLLGVPGIAVSLEASGLDYSSGDFNFGPLADFCAKNVGSLISLCSGGVFVSLNATSSDEYSEAVFASLCRRDYGDMFFLKKSADGFSGMCISEEIKVCGAEDCDYNAARSGKIAVSLIYAEPAAAAVEKNARFEF